MMKTRLPVFFFLWILFLFSVKAQVFTDSVFEKNAYKAINHVYNFEFERANEEISRLSEKYPEHPAPEFLFAANRWWQTYISITTPKYYDYIEKKLNLALDKNEKYEDNPAYFHEYTYLQFMTYALKARYHSYQGEWWKAANSARKVIGYLKDGFELTEARAEFYFSSGIYHYYAEVYPKSHPVARPFMAFFPDGDAVLGLKELENAGAMQNFAQAEALFYLADIYMFENKDFPKGARVAGDLSSRYPRNTWFRADYAQSLILNDQFDKAAGVLEKMIERYEKQANHGSSNITSLTSRYTTHLMTNVYNFKGQQLLLAAKDYAVAKTFFEKSMKMAKLVGVEENKFLASNLYHIGRCHDGLGQREAAVASYKKALKVEDNEYIKAAAKACLATPCTQ